MARKIIKKIEKLEIGFIVFSFIFSSLIMWKTFWIDSEGNMEIASKAWSDFAATIPLIRSFSFGSNFPPQYPIFAGPPIRYHFVFFMIVGFLEKIGVRIDWALNTLSTLGFSSLLILIYILGESIFKSKAIGILAVVLFLFNGSLGFLEFFKKHPLSLDTISQIINNNVFTSFGPYDGKIVSAFWSLNIYTNQRHLALAYSAFLFIVFLVFRYSKDPEKFSLKKVLLLGISIGLFPFLHLAVFAMMGLAVLTFFFVYPSLRKKLFISGVFAATIALPQYLYMGRSAVEVKLLNPGYLVENRTLLGYITYWFMNLGLTSILTPIGFILADKSQRKIFLPFLILFAVGNLFQFSPEVAANHKFFNLFLIGANFYTALLLIKLWNAKLFGKILFIPLFLILILTGIIDFFPIINDGYIKIEDIPQNKAAAFIYNNTPKDAVFLNSSYLYHPASIAGRKIFMGWPYFAWSAGYDTNKRGRIIQKVFSLKNKNEICRILLANNIDYLTIENKIGDRDFPLIDIEFFDKNFIKIYQDSKKKFSIISVLQNCK